jgi:hypothetical protein
MAPIVVAVGVPRKGLWTTHGRAQVALVRYPEESAQEPRQGVPGVR